MPDQIRKSVVVLVFAILLSQSALGQLVISSGGVDYTINFDDDYPEVNYGTYAGEGFSPTPGDGLINSNAWATTGMSDGDTDFGADENAGDFAGGVSDGGEVESGFYAFEVSNNNFAFGVHPKGDQDENKIDFAPGTITLKVKNSTTEFLVALAVSYKIWVNNDKDNSSSFNFSYSADNITYIDVPELDYVSDDKKTFILAGNADWQQVDRSTLITELAIRAGDFFYLRWSSDDVFIDAGTLGKEEDRDEFGLDDIVLNATTSDNPAPFFDNFAFYEYPTTSETVEVTVDITDVNNAVDPGTVNIRYGTTKGDHSGGTVTMSQGTGSQFIGTIPAGFNNLDSVYFVVDASDVGGATRTSNEQSYFVRNPVTGTLPYDQPFESDLGDCYVFSALGDTKEWHWSTEETQGNVFVFAEITGYNSGNTEEDWLILPGFVLGANDTAAIDFWTYWNYGPRDPLPIELLYSYDYSGTGPPSAGTWTSLDYQFSSKKQKWFYSEIVNLPDSAGTIYLAFKYTGEFGEYQTWWVNDIRVRSAIIADPEPTNYPTNFLATSRNGSTIETTWTDSQGSNLPSGYHVKISTSPDFTPPVDSIPISDDDDLSDGSGSRNIFYGRESVIWTNLSPNIRYYFSIFPYSNSGDIIDYKTDGTYPTSDALTFSGVIRNEDDIIITEFMASPGSVNDADGEWFELYNTTDDVIDLDGWLIESSSSGGTERHTILKEGGLTIQPKSFLVLGLNADVLTNGGVPVDYEYEDIFMSNTFDTLRLVTDARVLMDFIEWGDGSVWGIREAQTLIFVAEIGSDNNNGFNWQPSIVRENGYSNPTQSPQNIIEYDLGSPGMNGLFQNLIESTSWTGTGFWSQGNAVGKSNWSNGSPGSLVNVSIGGTVQVDLPSFLPARCAELNFNSGADQLIVPPNNAITTK